MGLHAHFLEFGWCASNLHPLYLIHRQSLTLRIPLEPLSPHSTLHNLPLRVLDLGHGEFAKEYVQSTGKRCRAEQKDFSSITLEKCEGAEEYQDEDWRFYSL
jgi:hypothetical protein